MHEMVANDYDFKLNIIKKGINNTHFNNDNSSIYLDHKDISQGFETASPASSYVGYFKNYRFMVKDGKEVPVADMYILHKDTAVFIAGGAPFAISPTAYQKSISTPQGATVKDFRVKSFGMVLDPAFGERNRINPITSEYAKKPEAKDDSSSDDEDIDMTAGDMVNFEDNKKNLEGEDKMTVQKFEKMIDKSGLKFQIQKNMEAGMDYGKAFDDAVKMLKFSVKKFSGANVDALRKLVDEITIKIEAKQDMKVKEMADIKSRIESVLAFEDPEDSEEGEDEEEENKTKEDDKDKKDDDKKDVKDDADKKDEDKKDEDKKEDKADSKDKKEEGESDDKDVDAKSDDKDVDADKKDDKDDKSDKGDAYSDMKKLAESSIKDFTEMEEKFNTSERRVTELETEISSLKEKVEGFKLSEYEKVVTEVANKVAKCYNYSEDETVELINKYKSQKLSETALEELGSVADGRLSVMSKKPKMVTKHSSKLNDSNKGPEKKPLTRKEMQDAQIDSLMGRMKLDKSL